MEELQTERHYFDISIDLSTANLRYVSSIYLFMLPKRKFQLTHLFKTQANFKQFTQRFNYCHKLKMNKRKNCKRNSYITLIMNMNNQSIISGSKIIFLISKTLIIFKINFLQIECTDVFAAILYCQTTA